MKRFSSPEINFVYPENWEIFVNDEGQSAADVTEWEEVQEVSLQNPNGAQWTIARYSPDESPDELIRRAIEVFQSEYEDLEVMETTEVIGEHHLKGVDIRFFYLDLLIVAEIRVIPRDDCVLVQILQSENVELEESREVFRAISLSLVDPGVLDASQDV